MPRKRQLDLRPIYYTYALFDWMGVPRWIGKGKEKRIDDHEKQSDPKNQLKNEFIEQTWIMLGEIPKTIIRDELTEIEAFAVERALINAIGRIDLGTGPLTNVTDGGEGTSGRVMTSLQRSQQTNIRIQTWANRSKEERKIMTQVMRDAVSPEDKTLNAQKAGIASAAARTTEQRIDFYLKGLGKLTIEQRQFLGRNYGYAKMTLEQRQVAGRKGQENRTFEDRSINMRKGWAKITPEARTERLKQAWITRKNNKNNLR